VTTQLKRRAGLVTAALVAITAGWGSVATAAELAVPRSEKAGTSIPTVTGAKPSSAAQADQAQPIRKAASVRLAKRPLAAPQRSRRIAIASLSYGAVHVRSGVSFLALGVGF
jgi:hypothetical protein